MIRKMAVLECSWPKGGTLHQENGVSSISGVLNLKSLGEQKSGGNILKNNDWPVLPDRRGEECMDLDTCEEILGKNKFLRPRRKFL